MDNILVAMCFDDDITYMGQMAGKFAQAFGAKLWLLHVASPTDQAVPAGPNEQERRETWAKELKTRHKALHNLATQLENNGIHAAGLVVQGATAHTILEEAKRLCADLIVIGHHFDSWLFDTFGQSTDIEVTDGARIPVLILPLESVVD